MYRLISLLVMSAFVVVANADGNAEKGKTLTAACLACHGQDGNSAAGMFPSIAGQHASYLVKQMQEIKDGTRPVAEMTGQLDNMSDQDLEDIAAFYASQSAKGGAANAELAAQGEAIYRNGIKRKSIAACSACHLPDGSGNAPAKFPALSGQWPDYTEKQLKAFRDGQRTNDVASMMRKTAMDMSDAEIKAVANYLYGLR